MVDRICHGLCNKFVQLIVKYISFTHILFLYEGGHVRFG